MIIARHQVRNGHQHATQLTLPPEIEIAAILVAPEPLHQAHACLIAARSPFSAILFDSQNQMPTNTTTGTTRDRMNSARVAYQNLNWVRSSMVVICGRHAEEREEHQEYENIVDSKRFLDQVAGEKLHSLVISHLASMVDVEVPPQHAVEDEPQRYPRDGPV